MSRVKSIRRRGTVERFSETGPLLKSPGDYVLIVRGVPRSIVMQCPDNCGEVITINLDRRSGPAWRIFESQRSLTIYPSVSRPTGCKAHFIVWNNRVVWCDGNDTLEWDDLSLVARVRAALPAIGYPHKHFEEIASELGAIPWEVLWACRHLERAGAAGSSARGAKFGAATHASKAGDGIDFKV